MFQHFYAPLYQLLLFIAGYHRQSSSIRPSILCSCHIICPDDNRQCPWEYYGDHSSTKVSKYEKGEKNLINIQYIRVIPNFEKIRYPP